MHKYTHTGIHGHTWTHTSAPFKYFKPYGVGAPVIASRVVRNPTPGTSVFQALTVTVLAGRRRHVENR